MKDPSYKDTIGGIAVELISDREKGRRGPGPYKVLINGELRGQLSFHDWTRHFGSSSRGWTLYDLAYNAAYDAKDRNLREQLRDVVTAFKNGKLPEQAEADVVKAAADAKRAEQYAARMERDLFDKRLPMLAGDMFKIILQLQKSESIAVRVERQIEQLMKRLKAGASFTYPDEPRVIPLKTNGREAAVRNPNPNIWRHC